MEMSHQVDRNAIKSGQSITIVLLVTAFIIDSWVLVTIVTLAQVLGALNLPFAPYRLIYDFVIKPSGLVKPQIVPDNPEPHRFALLMAGMFDGIGAVAIMNNAPLLGWVLVGIVVVLANLNVWVSFCMGCWTYYQLNRIGLPGFTRSPIR